MTDIRRHHMVLHVTNINLISPKKLTDYIKYIKTDEIPLIQKGEAIVFGVDTPANEHVGAAVVETAREPDNGPGHVLVIRDLYLTEDYRTPGVYGALISRISEEVIRRDYKGIVMQTAYPDDPVYESYLEKHCIRLDDGNTIYEVDVDLLSDHPFISKALTGTEGSVEKFSNLSTTEKNAFMSEWGDHFPKGLSPGYLPGKWLQDLSYVYLKGSEYRGFIFTSELSPEKLYIGSVYSDPGHPLVAGALIGRLGRDVLRGSDYRKVMFVAATDAGRVLSRKIVHEIKNVKKWKIHNYYLEV